MAAKDSNNKSKTSKTAHVMSLLSKKQEPAVPASEPDESAAAASTAPVPPILSSLGADAAVSVQIKNALEDALEADLNGTSQVQADSAPQEQAAPSEPAETPPQPEAASSAPAEASPQPEPEFSAPPEPVQAATELPAAEPVPVSQAEPEPVPVQPDPIAASVHAETPAQPLVVPERPGYINVMQVLVEEKAFKYAQMFGLCTCDRCMEDIKALTLNHLPPKYVVMGQHEMIPKLTFYEGKYSNDITTQLLHACNLVHKTPHHDR